MGKHGSIKIVVRRSSFVNRDMNDSLKTRHASRFTLHACKGFTLFEIVIALGVLAIGILGVLALFPIGLDAQKRAQDYSNIMILAEWKMADIVYRSHTISGVQNSLTAGTSYPTTQTTPMAFSQDNKYLWRYNVTPTVSGIANLYRVDMFIYSNDNTSTPIERVVSYIEKPD